jgi:hypothetical protein
MSATAPSSHQKSSFAPLSVADSSNYGISSATDKTSTTSNLPNHHFSEYISLAWQNMASIKSARKVSREANKAAKQYYTFTFIDDLDSDNEDILEKAESGENVFDSLPKKDHVELEEDESIYNSKFAFDDEEAWLGSRNKPEIEDIINNNDEKASVDNAKSKPAGTAKTNVIGVFVSQSSPALVR